MFRTKCSKGRMNFSRRVELNIKRSLHGFAFAILFLAMLVFSSSLTSAEVITYAYDNAGQVKKAIYGDNEAIG